MQTPRACFLCVTDPDVERNRIVVASGLYYPHMRSTQADHYTVSIKEPFSECLQRPLPVPEPNADITTVGGAIGAFLDWPASLVQFKDVPCGPTSAHSTFRPPCPPDEPTCPLDETEPRVPMEIGPECRMLQSFLSIDPATYKRTIRWSGPFMYSREVSQQMIKENDIQELLRGAWLSMAVIEVFIM